MNVNKKDSRLRITCVCSTILVMLVCGLFLGWNLRIVGASGQASRFIGHDEGQRGGQRGETDTIFVPALLASPLEAQSIPTDTPTAPPVPTDLATAIPTAQVTATPTPTPTPVSEADVLRYEGSTDQGQQVVVETDPAGSAVSKFEMDAQVVCPSGAGMVSIALDAQFQIINNRFRIRTASIGGNEHIFDGTITRSKTQMDGTWSVWLDGIEMLQPCNNKGGWSANLQPLQR